MQRLGPHSRPHKLAVIDGRRAEARRIKEIRAELEAHIGENVSVTQRMLIQRTAILMLRMEMMDRRSLAVGSLTEKDTREYLGWSNAVVRMLKALGLKGAPVSTPSLAERVAAHAAQRGKAA